MKASTTAQRLKAIMAERGLKQVDLFEACAPIAQRYGIKLNRSNISQYVNGIFEPNQDKLMVLSEALHVNPAWLMGYDEAAKAEVNPPSMEEAAKYFEVYPVGQPRPIPIIGTVRAGYGGLAFEDTEGYEMADVACPEEHFYLRIKGDSMEPRIHAGDLALIHLQEDVESGDVAVVIINGEEGTIKKVIKKEWSIVLQSFNPEYEPRVLSVLEMRSMRIVGKLVHTITKW